MPRLPGHRRAGQRRVPGHQARARSSSSPPSSRSSGSSSSSPATCARPGDVLRAAAPAAAALRAPAAALRRCRRSPRCCSCSRLDLGPAGSRPAGRLRRLARRGAARAPVAQALRPAAARLGPGDVHADLHPRPRQLADVLRRLPRAALRGHGAALAGGRGGDDVLRRRVLLRPQRRARAGARGHLARPVSNRRSIVDDEGYQIAQSLFAQADGGLFGQGFGQALLELPGGGRSCPRPTPT